jgi:hypothetical protein
VLIIARRRPLDPTEAWCCGYNLHFRFRLEA